MNYTFDILGVSPILHFFNHQQEKATEDPRQGAEYVATYECTLDAFLQSVEPVPPSRGWELDQVVDTVIHYWMNNAEGIQHWKERLDRAGNDNLLVARLADVKALKAEFNSLLG
ncbi:hypothetical protein [Roseofilum capinflatum]|uniref:Uncharacterized protein n=1 Tax=Roseofilum capinflatum BLCC-M114 TaxID=3022440 RepID=A0ABT7B609_9CYAN|nr:hypothetical protein [Roseofilum capinflatum]MDJ1174064.1 hypothetical protein [Roseofilum capinflatum BLCC-M114]